MTNAVPLNTFTPAPRSEAATQAAARIGERTMDTKRSITTKSGKVIELEEQEHTDEINKFFGKDANDDVGKLIPPAGETVDFGDGVVVTVPPVKPERRAWYQQASELNGFWSNVKGYMAHYAQGGDANEFVHKALGVDSLKQLPADSVKNDVSRIVMDAIDKHASDRVADALTKVGLPATSAGFKTATGYNKLVDFMNDGTHFSGVLKTIEQYERPEPSLQEQEQAMNRPAQATTNNRPQQTSTPPSVSHELDEAGIRAKYTIKMSRYNKKTNTTTYTDYLQTAGRVLLFRLKYRTGNILTTLLNVDDKGALMRAEIFDDNGKPLATGHAFTSSVGTENFAGRYLEKAETSAIGRALASAGFGTDAAGEDLDEEDQLSDSPVERR